MYVVYHGNRDHGVGNDDNEDNGDGEVKWSLLSDLI